MRINQVLRKIVICSCLKQTESSQPNKFAVRLTDTNIGQKVILIDVLSWSRHVPHTANSFPILLCEASMIYFV